MMSPTCFLRKGHGTVVGLPGLRFGLAEALWETDLYCHITEMVVLG